MDKLKLNNRLYYSLLVYIGGRWQVQFGDYEKSVVEAERDDIKEEFKDANYKFKIICTNWRQWAIDAEVNRLNGLHVTN